MASARSEAAPAAAPPRPGFDRVTRLPVSAPLYGRCLLVEANLCADCGGPDAERTESTLRGWQGGVKGLARPGWRRTMVGRTELLGGRAIGRAQLRSRCQQHSASGRDHLPEP